MSLDDVQPDADRFMSRLDHGAVVSAADVWLKPIHNEPVSICPIACYVLAAISSNTLRLRRAIRPRIDGLVGAACGATPVAVRQSVR